MIERVEYSYKYPDATDDGAAGSLYASLLDRITSIVYGVGTPQARVEPNTSAETFNAYAQALAQLQNQILESPMDLYAINDSTAVGVPSLVGESAQPQLLYWKRLDEVRERLHVQRGSDSQERFMFDIVAPFIEEFGPQALDDIDTTLEAMPRTARYFFPYLLGHLDHEPTRSTRLGLLDRYRASDDADIREGAVEALGYLES